METGNEGTPSQMDTENTLITDTNDIFIFTDTTEDLK